LAELVHSKQAHVGRPNTLLRAATTYVPAILKLALQTLVSLKVLTSVLRKKDLIKHM
jgi:hypothetical protein